MFYGPARPTACNLWPERRPAKQIATRSSSVVAIGDLNCYNLSRFTSMIHHSMFAIVFARAIVSNVYGTEAYIRRELSINELIIKIQTNRNNENALSELLPIVRSSFTPSTYEQVLITQLRDQGTSKERFRLTTEKLCSLLV